MGSVFFQPVHLTQEVRGGYSGCIRIDRQRQEPHPVHPQTLHLYFTYLCSQCCGFVRNQESLLSLRTDPAPSWPQPGRANTINVFNMKCSGLWPEYWQLVLNKLDPNDTPQILRQPGRCLLSNLPPNTFVQSDIEAKDFCVPSYLWAEKSCSEPQKEMAQEPLKSEQTVRWSHLTGSLSHGKDPVTQHHCVTAKVPPGPSKSKLLHAQGWSTVHVVLIC